MANEDTGFTVKEMIIRVDTKLDTVIADHEARLRILEKAENEQAGESTYKRWLVPVFVSVVSALGWVVEFLHH